MYNAIILAFQASDYEYNAISPDLTFILRLAASLWVKDRLV
jgi:hypothetical protein